MRIARETGTQLKVWEEALTVFDADGNPVSQDEVNELSALEWEDIIPTASRYSKESKDSIDPNTSLYDFFLHKSQNLFQDQPVEIAEQKRAKLLQMAQGWGAYIGSPIHRQSLKYFWLEECLEGENPFVAGTYRKILEAISEAAKKHAEIRLRCEVVEILSRRILGDDHVPSQPPRVKLAEGTVLSFDAVVLTTPLGWLKENKAAFKPTLPKEMSLAIDSISYGHLDKVYLTFPTAWWKKSSEASETSSTTKSNDSTNHPPQVFTFWLQPTYAPSTNPQQWLQECVDLTTLPPESSHPTLLFYIQGPQSKYIANLVNSSTGSDKDRDEKLIDFFLPYISKLPGYNERKRECKPSAVKATSWTSDKFAGFGSYSNFQVGLENGDLHIEMMRYGMPERGIWFAGEHTAPFIALGTTTGAYWSGEGVGKRIIETFEEGTKV
ncbi:related to anon-37cs protein [Ramularia collo-cygni]|uniref:Related to anon-37cs protein n=1 Tax=Ramularia collo-cygni TaxID=112498 RepID=A0A2D3VKB4_9PEZI|nr:related to anon-37cs protein [Ramularia collo-cygni]CZT22774.1 related to anon-37cs protein [Ramularia collo-cygni]